MTQTTLSHDTEIKNAVTRELDWLPNVDSTRIGVSVIRGAVTLTGEVSTYPEKLLAGKAAQRVRGVVGLAQEIIVHTTWSGVNDADIARESGEALQRAVDVPSSVKATVTNHAVTLTGEVHWQFQRAAAVRAVQYLKGVTTVTDSTTLRPSVETVDLKQLIKDALVRNAQLESQNIVVTTHPGGQVKLTGTVRSWSESRQVEHSCWAAPGVTAVDNELAVHYY